MQVAYIFQTHVIRVLLSKNGLSVQPYIHLKEILEKEFVPEITMIYNTSKSMPLVGAP